MAGYIIKKKVLGKWTYYLEGLELNGLPIWNGLIDNAKEMNCVNAMLVKDRLTECSPLEHFELQFKK